MSHRAALAALAATLAVSTAAVLVAARDTSVRREPPATARRAPIARTARKPAPRPTRRAPDPVLATARAYALAARNWTASSYQAAWRRQLALSTGEQRNRLRATRPSHALLAALRADRASSVAVVARARRDPAIRRPAARVVIWLDEHTETAGRVLAGQTRNTLRLRQARGRWRVTRFTIDPSAAAP